MSESAQKQKEEALKALANMQQDDDIFIIDTADASDENIHRILMAWASTLEQMGRTDVQYVIGLAILALENGGSDELAKLCAHIQPVVMSYIRIAEENSNPQLKQERENA